MALVAANVHIGRIPQHSATAGFKGAILCSESSERLLSLVLEDTFQLGISRHDRLVERYLKFVGQHIVVLPYKHCFKLTYTPQRQVRFRLQRAGHNLGSVYVEWKIPEWGSGEKTHTVFSSDLGAPAPLLPAAPRGCDRAGADSPHW